MFRTLLLTTAAMVAFAANSVLNRLALVETDIDPMTFTLVRIVSGAVVLCLILAIRDKNIKKPLAGSFYGAGSLLFYAIAFSFAYVKLGAGLGALVLFASVQLTMMAAAFMEGESPGPIEAIGIVLAFGAFVYLVYPGLSTPDALSMFAMIIAGVSWGFYSLIGRGSEDPIADTTGNFVRATPIVAILAIYFTIAGQFSNFDQEGLIYAILSGALASGVGYAIWYAALPALARTTAGVVQLTVPAIAAFGGILFLGEALTLHFMIATALIFAGVIIATLAKR